MRQGQHGASQSLGPRASSYSDRVSDKTESTESAALPPEGTDSRPGTQGHDQPIPEAYATFMRQGWGDRELDVPEHPVAAWAARRRTRLGETFPGERLVIPAGGFKVRSNDTDYRFRPDTAHTYLSGNQTSDAVLVVEGGRRAWTPRPRPPGPRRWSGCPTGRCGRCRGGSGSRCRWSGP